MSTVNSRRQFFRQTGRNSAAIAAVATFGDIGGLAPAHAAAPALRSDRRDVLLETLGARIGVEIADMIGSAGATLTLTVLDAAGPSCDPLAQGLQAPIACADRAHASREVQVPNGDNLAVAIYRNERTGTGARVEVFTAALSHIQLIEADAVSAVDARRQLLALSADSLYRVSYS